MSVPANPPTRPGVPAATAGWLAAGGLVVATLLAYHNTFAVPFVFDDVPVIVENESIRHFWPLGDVLALHQAGGLTTSGRPVLSLSLALNYAISGNRVWSYHAVNLLIHLGAGLALFGLVRRTLPLVGLPLACGEPAESVGTPSRLSRSPRDGMATSASPTSNHATLVAFLVAAAWTLHPLQTESVTYVVQRAESLAGLFFLLTLYCYLRAAERNPIGYSRWSVAAVAACTLAMATKEIAASAPLLVLLYDRTFLGGTFRAAWKARRDVLLGLAATWILLAGLVIATEGRGGTAGFGSWTYALTQCRAIVDYLKLSVWPHPLVFDYGLGTARSLAEVWWQAVVVLALLAATVALLARRSVVGFLGAWFFLVLAPSSSVVPITTQTIAEHRMYLPLAALVALAVPTAFAALGRRGALVCGVAVGALGIATVARNHDYRSEGAIWGDAAAKLPSNARAHNNFGLAQFRAGRVAESIVSYERALRLQPKYPETHFNLGVALASQDRGAQAIEHYEAAVRFAPNYPEALNNLGNALAAAGRIPEAIPRFEEAIARRPTFAVAYLNLGNALLEVGRPQGAESRFQRALKVQPDYPEARFGLGNAFAAGGRMAEALQEYRRAIQLKPDYADAHVNAGNALLELERPAEALVHYERAIALNPRLAMAHVNAGRMLLDLERWAEAIPHFEAALRLEPDLAIAQRGIAHAREELARRRK